MDRVLLREFSSRDLQRFSEILGGARRATTTYVDGELKLLLSNAKPLAEEVQVPKWRLGDDRFSTALAIYRGMPSGAVPRLSDGVWAWLAAYRFDALCQVEQEAASSAASYKVGNISRWVIDPDPRKRSGHRHLLRGPLEVVDMYRDDLECARFIVAGQMGWHGDSFESMTANQLIVGNKPIVQAAMQLYFDRETGQHRPGSTRRTDGMAAYVRVVKQLMRTYDIARMAPERIVGLLPHRQFAAFLS